jgi:hypothetical protein
MATNNWAAAEPVVDELLRLPQTPNGETLERLVLPFDIALAALAYTVPVFGPRPENEYATLAELDAPGETVTVPEEPELTKA